MTLSIFINTQNLSAIALALLCSGCSSGAPKGVDLVCTVDEKSLIDRECTSVPSLVEGELVLSANRRFSLKGRYDACYQVEHIQMSGDYTSDPHNTGIDMELLATNTQTDQASAKEVAQTVGLLNLDTKSLEARFSDTAAVIRSRGQLLTAVPSLMMRCKKQ